MTIKQFAAVTALALSVAACGQKRNAASGNQNAPNEAHAPAASDQVYSGTGTVQSITGDRVAIAHGPIAGIGWPAMTIVFTAPSNLASGAKVGDKVHFSFQKSGSVYVLTSVVPK